MTAAGLVPGRGGRNRFELRVTDDSGGTLMCVWFRGANWIHRLSRKSDTFAFHGKVEVNGSPFSMAHTGSEMLEGA